LAKLRLKTETPSGPLCRRPGGGKHKQEDDGDLTPEYLGCGHSQAFRWWTLSPMKESAPYQDFNIGQAPIAFMRVVA
jgi:hypothetical protein